MAIYKWLIPIMIISVCVFCFRIIFNPINYNVNVDMEELGLNIDDSWDISVNDNSISTANIKNSNGNYVILMKIKKIGTNVITLANNRGSKYQFLISANKNRNVDIVKG